MEQCRPAIEKAVFAGGCFWCLVKPFAELNGVKQVTVGYTGGTTDHPTYEEVCAGIGGHREAVEVVFRPDTVSYQTGLDIFWRQIDPTDAGGQFFDRGRSYQTAVYYQNEQQEREAKRSKSDLENSGRFSQPIVTEILPAAPFYPAEEYHQDYYVKNPAHYCMYAQGSGRTGFIKKHWGVKGE